MDRISSPSQHLAQQLVQPKRMKTGGSRERPSALQFYRPVESESKKATGQSVTLGYPLHQQSFEDDDEDEYD